MLRSIAALAMLAGLLVACAPKNPDGYTPGSVENLLSGVTYRGEWREGFLYEVTFTGVGAEMTALVHVIDSDAARTEYNMPATVSVVGNNVTLTFTRFDRVDHLVFDPISSRLDGHTAFEGKKRNEGTWAVPVSSKEKTS